MVYLRFTMDRQGHVLSHKIDRSSGFADLDAEVDSMLDEIDDVPTSMGDDFLINRDISLAMRAEAAGYDSVWTPEHHFTGYVIGPDPIQTLAFIAARTKRV